MRWPEATSHWTLASVKIFLSLLFSNFPPAFTCIAPSVCLPPSFYTDCTSFSLMQTHSSCLQEGCWCGHWRPVQYSAVDHCVHCSGSVIVWPEDPSWVTTGRNIKSLILLQPERHLAFCLCKTGQFSKCVKSEHGALQSVHC